MTMREKQCSDTAHRVAFAAFLLAASATMVSASAGELPGDADIPDDPQYAQQWALGDEPTGIHARAAWQKVAGAGTIVAILGPGITLHPEMAGQVLPGFDFITDPQRARDGDGRDRDPSDSGDWQAPYACDLQPQERPSRWDGTRAAGVIAALTDNARGIAGVAHGARVVPVRVRGACGVSDTDLADAVRWAGGDDVAGVPRNTNPARVMLVEAGGEGDCPALVEAAIAIVRERGASVVVAAGDQGGEAAATYPGNCHGVITVGAHDLEGHIPDFSNHGTAVALTAPGLSILSLANSGSKEPSWPIYSTSNGTFMAAAHVAGVIALMQSAASVPLMPDQVRNVLQASARPLPFPCIQGCGAGGVDAGAAVSVVSP
jgi:serine protease